MIRDPAALSCAVSQEQEEEEEERALHISSIQKPVTLFESFSFTCDERSESSASMLLLKPAALSVLSSIEKLPHTTKE